MILKNAFVAILALIFLVGCTQQNQKTARKVDNFNTDWTFHKGDVPGAFQPDFDDTDWRQLDLPHDWSIEGPFSPEWASGTGYLPGGIGWYRKSFIVPRKKKLARFLSIFTAFIIIARCGSMANI